MFLSVLNRLAQNTHIIFYVIYIIMLFCKIRVAFRVSFKDDIPICIENHYLLDDFPKISLEMLHIAGKEIPAITAIIIAFQPISFSNW